MNKRFWALALSTTMLSLAILVALPHSKYLRYQALNIGVYAKARWIYERIHFDQTPIDVAFIGTSHTLNSIDSRIVSQQLSDLSGQMIVAANLAIPHYGRDMHLTLIKELLNARKPRAIVIEVRESEARDSHPAAHYLADRIDLLTAPLIVNLNYLGNLARLPYRQGTLFMKTTFPELFAVNSIFNQRTYRGPHVNYTLTNPIGRKRERFIPQAELRELRAEYMRKNAYKFDRENSLKTYLYYNANYSNLKRAIALAKKSGVDVFFLYLPDYGSRNIPVDSQLYDSLAPVIYPDMATFYNADVWLNMGHLNASGAMKMSHEVARKLFEQLQALNLTSTNFAD